MRGAARSCAPKKIFERTEGLTFQSWPNPSSGVAGAPVTTHPLTLSPRTSGPCSSRGEAVGRSTRTRCAGAPRTEPWGTGISGIKRGRPHGDDEWVRQTFKALNLEHTVHREGRRCRGNRSDTDSAGYAPQEPSRTTGCVRPADSSAGAITRCVPVSVPFLDLLGGAYSRHPIDMRRRTFIVRHPTRDEIGLLCMSLMHSSLTASLRPQSRGCFASPATLSLRLLSPSAAEHARRIHQRPRSTAGPPPARARPPRSEVGRVRQNLLAVDPPEASARSGEFSACSSRPTGPCSPP